MHRSFLFRTTLVFVLLALIQGWAGRFYFGPDALSYLEMGEFLIRGDLSQGINSYWSPIYAILLGLTSVLNPFPIYWQSTLITVGLNSLIGLLNLGSFSFFLRELERRRNSPAAVGSFPNARVFRLSAYVLLAWGVLRQIGVHMITPDLLLMALNFFALAIFLKVSRVDQKIENLVRLSAALGATLSLAYLTKSFMFLLSPFLLVGTAWIVWRRRSLLVSLRCLLAAFVTFSLISAVWIVPLSLQHERFTFGETGRLNFAWHVNRAPLFVHWQGDEAGTGTPHHTTRLLHDSPSLYEFSRPFTATYPPWYAPGHWFEGIKPEIHLGSIFRKLFSNLARLGDILLPEHIFLAPLFLILFVSSRIRRESTLQKRSRDGGAPMPNRPPEPKIRDGTWNQDEFFFLLIFCLLGIALFLPVHVEDRYIAGFLVAGWVTIFSAIRLRIRSWKRTVSQLSLALCLATLIVLSLFRAVWPHYPTPPRWEHENWQIARALHAQGIEPEARLCAFGDSLRFYWAYLAEVRIVAEVPRILENPEAASRDLEPILTPLSISGIVAEAEHRDLGGNWIQLDDSPLFLKKLPPAPSAP